MDRSPFDRIDRSTGLRGTTARQAAARRAAWRVHPVAALLALGMIVGIASSVAKAAGDAYLPFTVKRAEHPAQEPTAPIAPTADPGATPGANPVAWPPPDGPDALAETLAWMGAGPEAIGYRPRGDWTRFPLPQRTPYLLPMFEPLFDDPFRAYTAAREMGNAADRWLHPHALANPDDALFRLPYYLGLDRLVGNFRDYSANVAREPAQADPLREAVRDLYAYAGEDTVHFTFGFAVDLRGAESALDAQLPGLSEPFQRALARALVNQLDAIRWRDRGLRRVDPETARRVFVIRDLGDTQGDGALYYPEIDDVMADLDAASFHYAGRKAVELAHRLELELAALEEADRCPDNGLDVPTPFGRIVAGTCGDDQHRGGDVLLSVDPGGDDLHLDNAGGTSRIEVPVAIAVDLAGDDQWRCGADDHPRGACQGAGILGHGVLIDAAGDDVYEATHHAQGLGLIGQGILVDQAGSDQYRASYSAQGAGFFGYGGLFDARGADRYQVYFDGQGYGGVGGGVGVLADREGDDDYHAPPGIEGLPEPLRYRNYAGNGQPNTVISFVQGASAGRRGDGSDGHSWPGGLGALIDVMGDDRYTAGAFSQAYGYWYGIGLIYDGAGNDDRQSVYYSLASGAHYAVSAIVDEGGDDRYRQVQDVEGSTAGAGVAFAWDYVNALIFDRSGDDHYESRVNCLARAAQKGNALLIDGGGADTYVGGARGDGSLQPSCLGSAQYVANFGADPYRSYLTGFESGVFSLLLDLGGADTYLARDFATGETYPVAQAGDDRQWWSPDPEAATGSGVHGQTYRSASVFGLGLDRADGRIARFDRIPPPATPAPPAAGLDAGAPVPARPAIQDLPLDGDGLPAEPRWQRPEQAPSGER